MKNVLIICQGGMSSSVLAKKTTESLKENGNDIQVEATSTNEGREMIEKGKYDLFLVSPQTKMYYDQLKKTGERSGKPVVNIPPQAYVPVPMGIEKLSNLILQELSES
ncbi:PTS cellobiose transporter subunit IIB [Tetragenococcus koreensis]|uniref:Cellobiose-specific PTS system IIB component n=1 Tax=Tetragenococcus koreensis TaxID=290335 RepID=A0AAN4UBS7_9ENTE|nr:PTS cellobiose transporter subunit IIB [Tetragenococcus koreensis]MCF1615449.1 PTS cellobiose transporter subunit IIB [Tetragenococcus koreensis]MCF1617774.1 PTS cellobiose transporter subunit IIB [Tetragenococcus koreensis]MCF1622557.1 PTS cellobiose transporter subunit IIB [Tetragenococcus koreensis]MCF1625257.1 PTS cellobiose transporter subunit IIB [Tetragenococcus koreensis]MCF1627943.1 PTS cellobiose transporter subunit IIB [Tetragenococcus koreensis]